MKAENLSLPAIASGRRRAAVLLIRVATASLWAAFLFVCTCTYNFDRLLVYFDVHFIRNPRPDWHELLLLFPQEITAGFILQKIGHFSGFFTLAFLLLYRARSLAGLYAAFAYAVLTEILQLYFFRDGRLIDLLFDGAGIAAACLLCMRRPVGRS